MDQQAYISSGILESYVLGQVTDQEKQEVECMASIYPEIHAELIQVQSDIEKLAHAIAIPVSVSIKEKILVSIDDVSQDNDGKQISLKERTSSKSAYQNSMWKLLAAACFMGCIISISFFLLNNNQLSEYAKKNENLENDKRILENDLLVLREKNFDLTEKNEAKDAKLAFLTKEETSKIILKNPDPTNSTQSIVYWNEENRDALIDISSLPTLPSTEDYQLWIMIGEKPTSIGVISKKNSLQALPKISKADAFAITIEKKGGSKTPTLEKLIAIGKT